MSESQLAGYQIAKSFDISVAARTSRMLAVLADIEKPRRARLSRAVTQICRSVLSFGGVAGLEFGIADADGEPVIQVTVKWMKAAVAQTGTARAESGDTDPEPTTGESDDSAAPEMAVRRVGELLDGFSLVGWPGVGAQAVLRMKAPPGFEFTATDVADWTALLAETQMEEALHRAEQRRKRLAWELDTARLQDDLIDEAGSESSDTGLVSMLSLVASQTDNGVAILDGEARFAWVNNAFTGQWGYDLNTCVNRAFADAMRHEESDETAMARINAVLQTGSSDYVEVLAKQADGNGRWTGVSLTPSLDESGRIQRWIVLLRDITQQKSASDLLAAARDAAEQANRSKSEFLANMSHEIRTPMNAVIGMTELALGTELTPEQHEYLTTVRVSAEALLELLNDILDLSKIEAGKVELDEVDFDLAEVVRDSLKALAVKAHSKGLELATRMPMDLPHHLHGDPLRLRQVIINLADNAIKFTNHGEVVVEFTSDSSSYGRQTVETTGGSGTDSSGEEGSDTDAPPSGDGSYSDSSYSDSGNGRYSVDLNFTVRDTGIGIPAEGIQRIFESFTQVDASTTRQYGGTGLGLTITSELLRLMGGHVRVESEVGVGSSFHVSVPFRTADSPARSFAGRVDLSRKYLEDRTVLVVDDNATNRHILEEMLTNWGLRPRMVSGADEALRELEAAAYYGRPFDLLLVDSMMPGADGFEMVAGIRRREDLNAGTVMMLSSADRADSARRCRELGINTYLVKPVSQSSLLESILNVLSAESPKRYASALDRQRSEPPHSGERGYAAITEQAVVSLRILIADDHEANRLLAEKILAKRGHRSTHARTGREVLDLLQSESFDLILMDVQMPELDGLQATAEIRQAESLTGTHMPIVALTAHAMKGDSDKCLTAGMDGYLSKPLRAGELVILVEKLCEPAATARKGTRDARPALMQTADRPEKEDNGPGQVPDEIKAGAAERIAAVDFTGALNRMDSDVDLLIEQMQFFLNDAPQLVRHISDAIASGRGPQLQSSAHRLKGLVSSYDDTPAAELCLQLEFAGRDSVFQGTADCLAHLSPHVDRLLESIRRFVSEHTTA